MANLGGRHQYLGGTIQEHDEELHQIWIGILIISGSYGGHRRHTTDDRQRHR